MSAAAPPALRTRFAAGVGWAAAGRGGGFVFALVANAFAARLMSPSTFGTYAVLVSVATGVGLIGQLGLTATALRAIGARVANGDSDGGWVVAGRAMRLAVAAALIVILTTSSPIGLIAMRHTFWQTATVLGIVSWAVLAGLKVLESVTPEIFRGFHDLRRASTFGLPLSSCLLAIALAVVAGAGGHLSLEATLAISVAASAVALAPALARIVKNRPRAGVVTLPPEDLLHRTVWVSSVLAYALGQLDLWMAGYLASPEDAARYAAAFKLATFVSAPLLIVNLVLSPMIVELLTGDDRPRLESLLKKSATAAAVPALGMLTLFTAFAAGACDLVYGPAYRDAGSLLTVLSVGQAVTVLSGSCALTLMMAGYYAEFFVAYAVAIAFTVVTGILLYSWHGVIGIAIAAAAGLALHNLIAYRFVWNRLGIRTAASVTLERHRP